MVRSTADFKARMNDVRAELENLGQQQKAISAKTHHVLGPTAEQQKASQAIYRQQSFLYAEIDRLGVILGHCSPATPRAQESWMRDQKAFVESRTASGAATPALEAQTDWLHAEKEALDQLGFFSPDYKPKRDEWCEMSLSPGYY